MPQDNPKQNLSHEKQPNYPDQEFFTPKMMEPVEIKTLLSWEAPARPFRKKDRSYYTTSAIIVILLVLIAFLAHEFLLIGVLLSFIFVVYVLAFVAPNNVSYRISTQGVTIGDDFYFWHFLDSFWFKEKETFKVLYIQTRFRFPAQLILVLPPKNAEGTGEEEVKKIMARFLPFLEKPYRSWMEKWSEGLQKHFPLENIHR